MQRAAIYMTNNCINTELSILELLVPIYVVVHATHKIGSSFGTDFTINFLLLLFSHTVIETYFFDSSFELYLPCYSSSLCHISSHFLASSALW